MIYLVADTETTDATDDRGVCEIGWVAIDEDWNILERVDSLIDPEKDISAAASGIHGLVNADVENSPTLKEFFTLDDPSCYGRRFTGPVTLIGHRIGFDRPAFGPYVDGEVFELDTLRYVRQIFPDMDNHQLSTCKYALNLPKDEGTAHRVMADVMVTYHLAKRVAQVMNMTLPELAKRFRVYYKKVDGQTATSYTMDHSAGSYVYDTQGRVRLYTRYGSGAPALAGDVKKLLAE